MKLPAAVVLAAWIVSPASQAPAPEIVYKQGDPGVVEPTVKKQAKPDFPERAQRERISGTLLMETIVGVDGRARNIRLIKSLDRRFGTDEEAIKALRKWEFTPATKDGVPVPMEVSVEMTFVIRGAAGRAIYGNAKHVISLPELTAPVLPVYTPATLAQKIEGTVVIEAVVEIDGTVGAYEIIERLHPELEDSAVRALTAMKFKPAAGRRGLVPYAVVLNFPFKLGKLPS